MFRNRKHIPRNRSGQSTVEYIVLVTAVIAVIIFFVAPGKDGKSTFQNKMVNMLNQTTDGMEDKSETLADSHADVVPYKPSQQPEDVTARKSLFSAAPAASTP